VLPSFAQQLKWSLNQAAPGSPVYNIPVAYRISGRLHVEVLQRSLREIVHRHEALRTTFPLIDGRPAQVLAPDSSFALPVTDLRQLAQSQRESEAQRLATQEAQRPFNLARGPLFEASLLQLSEAEHLLVLNMHHIVADGWSFGVMMRELATLYQAFSDDKPSPLPEPPIQYADFAVWQREWMQGEAANGHLNYWKKQLGGQLPTLQLPFQRQRPAVETHRGANLPVVISKELTEALKALGQREGATLFMTLLAAFQVLLHRCSGQEDVIVGSPTANRNRSEIEGLIGFFVNTLMLRVDLSGTPTFKELLAKVREATFEAYAHQELPFERLAEELQPERDLSSNPLFQAVFALQDSLGPELQISDLIFTPMYLEHGSAMFDLMLELFERPAGLRGRFVYNTDLFDTPSIARMAGDYRTLLEGIVADPERRISDLPLLSHEDRQRILMEQRAEETVHGG
jgi:aspartate racemase